jgi:uncharacterized protein (DUF1697 family)
MPEHRYVALLRGINVGGRNIIKMSDLRACFEDIGFSAVSTYIQSGNVLFSSRSGRKAQLVKAIEASLSDAFRYDSCVVVVSAPELRRVIEQAPDGFGESSSRYRYDVVFLKDPLTSRAALEQVTPKPGVDTVDAGERALYFRRLISRAAQSHLTKLIQRPVYKSMTIRNWNTTTQLHEMASATV